jgi:hypothetical protein
MKKVYLLERHRNFIAKILGVYSSLEKCFAATSISNRYFYEASQEIAEFSSYHYRVSDPASGESGYAIYLIDFDPPGLVSE